MLRLTGFIICLVLTLSANAQNFSNKGKDFWITFPAHVDQQGAVMGIYITSDNAASGQVQFGATTIPFSITPNTVKRVFLGPGGDAPNTSVYLSQIDGVAAGAGVHVTSDNPVVVYSHIIFRARSGACLVLPTNVWGKEYVVPSYGSSGQSGPNSGIGIINVMAKEANTTIEIVPTVNTVSGKTAGAPYSVTLNNIGDVYQVQFVKDADISGTTVKSIASAGEPCKPIAVISATTWSAFDCMAPSGGDNLLQQLFPTGSFGKNFITAPFKNRNYDILRVFVTDPATVVRRTENGVTTTLTGLQRNSFYEIKTNLPNNIVADKPISVVQYITSQTCNPSNTPCDPEMIVLNPVEQTINNITVFSAHQNFVPPGQSNVNTCYLNIIIRTNATNSFKINGIAPGGSWVSIPGTGYSYLQADISTLAASNPVQYLTADSNFSAIAYGYGNVESYGYNAGTYIKDLYQYVQLRMPLATTAVSATCINSDFKFSIILPYQTSSIKWLFNGQFTDVTISNPTYDSSFVVDGKTLYRYTLPNNYRVGNIGSYPVSVVVIDPGFGGCGGEQQIDFDLEVYDKPRAAFTWQHNGCITDPFQFKDTSYLSYGTINRWNWDFGDGTSSTVNNPSKVYNTAGTYTVKQTVITDVGCSADSTATVLISSIPTAKFTTTGPYCLGNNLKIADASTITSGTIARWFWDFGNGHKDSTTSATPPVYAYPASGTFTIALMVASNSGCKSTVYTQTISVGNSPTASFTLPTAVCLPSGQASFTNTSTSSDASALTYLWDFGDGKTSTAKDPVHQYAAGGPFMVKLTATSALGCVDDSIQTLSNIYAQPKADFTFTNVCIGAGSNFTDASTATNQTISSYAWDLGDGIVLSTQNVSKTFASAGVYSIKHWAVSDKGCKSDTAIKSYTVYAKPVAVFITDAAVCQDKAVNFVSQSAASPVLNRWQWNFGDGNTRDLNNGDPLPYTYSTVGARSVSLVVTSVQGCVSDTTTKSIQVNVLPQVNFGLPEVCLSDAFAKFTDSSTISDGSQASFNYLWNFADPGANAGNPNTSTVASPTHKYSAAANYNVSLTVTSNNGCSSTATKTLTVNGDRPKADFSFVNNNALICSGDAVSISNKSSVNFGTITKTEIYWEWPGTTVKTTDDDPALNKTYSHRYAAFSTPASKTFSVRFLAYSGGVCVDEIIKTVQVTAVPKIVFQPIPGICLSDAPRQITQAAEGNNVPGTGVYSGTGVNASGLFDPAVAGTGTFRILYTYTATAGCKDTASQTITVWPKPVAGFTVSSPVCASTPATFTDASSANTGRLVTWNWDFGDGTTASNNSGTGFQKTYNTVGGFTVSLRVISDIGCTSDAVTKNITIAPIPVADFDLPAACANTPVQFFDKSTISDGTESQFTYVWQTVEAGGSASQKNPVLVFPNTNTQTIKLTVTSGVGCANSATKTLSGILAQPMANFNASPLAMCEGGEFDFTDASNPLSQSVSSWYWSFGDDSISADQNSSHIYTRPGTFSVKHSYTTQEGCWSDTIIKQVTVYPIPDVDAGPDIVVVENQSKLIPAKVNGSINNTYLWSPGTYLSSTSILQPIVSPAADLTYILTVTGDGGCIGRDTINVAVALAPIVPNAFSPNGDGINDTWYIKYLEFYPGATINVFDRYGRQVYGSIGYPRPWDGTVHGTPLPVGVYYYVIDPKNGKQRMSGSLTLLK